MKGLRIVITYSCNIMCGHCKYRCSPLNKGVMGVKEFQDKVLEEYNNGFTDYLLLEGGEPFLYSGIIFKYLRKISHLNMKKYIVTNGFWGNIQPYTDILRDLKLQGLSGIIFEYDYFHSHFIDIDTIKKAIQTSRSLEMEVKLKAVFLTGSMKTDEDMKTYEYVKDIRRTHKDMEVIFDEVIGEEEYLSFSKRQMMNNERVILYKEK